MALVLRRPDVEAEPVKLTYNEGAALPAVAVSAISESPPSAIAYAAPARVAEPLNEIEFEALRQRARDEGFAAGREAGERAARAELEEHLGVLCDLVQSFREALRKGIDGAEDVAVEIAFTAVCKVLGEAAPQAHGVRALVREAMAHAHAAEPLVLRVSPADHALLFSDADCMRAITGDPKLEIVADQGIAAGCVIETAGGMLDARLDVQLRRLMDTLIRAREARTE